MSRSSRQEAAAKAKAEADAHRKETQAGVENAGRGPFGRTDRAFADGWTAQRQPEQDYLDGQASDAAKAAKRRWR